MPRLPLLRIFLALTVVTLAGCGEPTAEGLRKDYTAMSAEKLQAAATALRSECRQPPVGADQLSDPCPRLKIAEAVAESKGWCWGPHAAASSDMSWMRCSEDVTRSALAKTWYASTKSGSCREASLNEAIGQVLDHDGPWNIKTSLSKSGFFDASSQLKDGTSYSIRLYPSCAAALMLYVPSSGDGPYVAAPLGMSLKEAGNFFDFDTRNCSVHPVFNQIGCGKGYEKAMEAPIQLSDGYVPCSVNMPVQFDFQRGEGMVGVTCGVSEDSKATFEQKMAEPFGASESPKPGVRLWKRGPIVAKTIEYGINGRTLRYVAVVRAKFDLP